MNHKAFTLIELLVVVLIIGILSAIALPQYTQAVEKSRAAEAISNLGAFDRAFEVWRLAHPDRPYRCFTGNCYGVGELDISIPDDWVQGTSEMIDTGNPESKSCSKNFCYGISEGLNHRAYRANSSTYKYVIQYNPYHKYYYCVANTEADLKLCKSLSNMKYVDDSL